MMEKENTFIGKDDLIHCSVCKEPKQASEQMGHSDIATTRKLYYFCNKSEKTKIAQINNAINF